MAKTGYVHELLSTNPFTGKHNTEGYLYYIIEENQLLVKHPSLLKPVVIMNDVDMSLYGQVLNELISDDPSQNKMEWWEMNNEGWSTFINNRYLFNNKMSKLIMLDCGYKRYEIIFDRVIPLDHFPTPDRDLKINLEKET